LALPDHRAQPPGLFEEPDVFLVSTHISKKLLRPVINIGSGNPRPFAVLVRMPEAAVYKQRRLPAGKNEIGFPGQIGTMKSKAEPQRVRRSPNRHLWARVLGFDLGHRPRAMCGILPRRTLLSWHLARPAALSHVNPFCTCSAGRSGIVATLLQRIWKRKSSRSRP
jgi:hypothetical protein